MFFSRTLISRGGLLGIILVALPFYAQATPLNLTLPDSPDVAAFFIDVSYDAEGNTLSANGDALDFTGDSGAVTIANGLFMLQASIDDSGALSGGSFTISGTIASLGYTSGTLLQGTLTDFGFGSSQTLEFLFLPTAGDLAALYGSVGGIILSQTGFSGSFLDNFGTTSAVADIGAVPVPAAAWLMLSALAALTGLRRRR